MHPWQIDLHRGRRWLRRHRPLRALATLERALLSAPTERRPAMVPRPSLRSPLATAFYELGVALRKAGMHNRAIGCFVESARLHKRGFARRKLLRSTNAYGMARQASQEVDDQQAFYGVQLGRYVRSKQSHRLGTRAEIDMIAELIDDYWDHLRSSGALAGRPPGEKLRIFRDTVIVFPFLTVPEALKTEDLAVDFVNGRRLEAGDRCVCGSGLPYMLCHGRIPGTDEVLTGRF